VSKDQSLENMKKHLCVQCCFNGFEEGNCNIDTYYPGKDTMYCIAKSIPTPKYCPFDFKGKVTMLDMRKK